MINDPYLTLEAHAARVDALRAQAATSRLARALRSNASSTVAEDHVLAAGPPGEWAGQHRRSGRRFRIGRRPRAATS